MKNRKRIGVAQIVLIVLISLLVGYWFGTIKVNFDWNNYHPVLNVIGKEPPSGVVNIDFNPFWNVWERLQAGYYDKSKLDQQKMLNGAIQGMVQSLGDPFTMYLPPVQNDNFKQGLAGQFSGIGAELGIASNNKDVIVIAPLDGSPAEKAGIKAGDTILRVDGQVVNGTDLTAVVNKIRGPKGTKVTLTVSHKDSNGKQQDITITRDTITVKSVTDSIKTFNCSQTECKASDDKSANTKIGYIRLSQFGDNTNQEWLAAVKDLNSKMAYDKNVKGIILDLRNNPGGYLTDATFVAGEFLPQGTPVVIQDDGQGNTKTLSVDRTGTLLNVPLIVLINKGSASASEIVSGALRDNKRAKLVGDTSFGKGTIQQAEDLGDGAGLHVTIAKWLTPNKTWVNGKGLTPDVSVSLDPKDPSRDTQLEKGVYELVK